MNTETDTVDRQVVIRPAVGQQRPHTHRFMLDGAEFEVDLTHEPNRQMLVEWGYLFPEEGQR